MFLHVQTWSVRKPKPPKTPLASVQAQLAASREAAGKEASEKVAALEQQCAKLEVQKNALAQSLQDGQAEIAGLQVTPPENPTGVPLSFICQALNKCLFACIISLAWS